MKKGLLAYTMYGHTGEISSVAFTKKGDYFATGGTDSNIFIWKSAFCKPYGEEIKSEGVCESGHRKDSRTELRYKYAREIVGHSC